MSITTIFTAPSLNQQLAEATRSLRRWVHVLGVVLVVASAVLLTEIVLTVLR